MGKVYYDKDADLKEIKKQTIAIIGYGIQGRNQSLNMRESGLNVIVGNIDDHYAPNAIKDGFKLYSPEAAAERADIIYMLIPDDAQGYVYEQYIRQHMTKGKAIVFAHGFSIRYGRIVPPKDVDVMLMAPRMPGKQIREYFLNGSGAPVFIGVHQNYTKRAKHRVLAMAKAIGATRIGALEVSFEEETEVDHFIEHFLLPIIVRAIRVSYDALVEEGYSKEVALLETYASGEIGELILEASRVGLYQVFQQNTSPTAQFGMAHYAEKVFPDSNKKMIKDILKKIKNGEFEKVLKKEGLSGYKHLKKVVKDNNQSDLIKTHHRLQKMIKISGNEAVK
ncbi:MAG: ketol-acid reductoisomerase [Oligoflexia bacterium]|nr:ketol-acid reductoisomerase [Oligoflexia bacterium]